MIEMGILEHPIMRKELAKLGIAEVFVAGPFDNWQTASNNEEANRAVDALIKSFAEDSGYRELNVAPVIPMGHSAAATFPWNFAAWNPQRTLAILSIHGDAPETDRTGNSRPNADWGERNIDGIPGLMVMGEYEWWDDRLLPALKFRGAHPKTPLAMLAEPGNGHFNYCDQLVQFLAMFIHKAVEARLPADEALDRAPVLKPVDPAKGWLVQRWHLNQRRTIEPAPFAKYRGSAKEAFWAFDKEMAWAIQNYFGDQPGKLPQLIGFVQDGKMVTQTESMEQVRLKFEPLDDGVTFHLQPKFLESVESGSKNMARWTYLPVGSPLGHASGGGPIQIHKITGPVKQVGATTFAASLDRLNSTVDRRNLDMWLWANHPGDEKYKSIVQQVMIKIPPFSEGAEQHITFPPIPDQLAGARSVELRATSDSKRKVYYYVREGPAEIEGDQLKLTKIPPRAKLPVAVTVVAWQLGRDAEPKWQTATPVDRTFLIRK